MNIALIIAGGAGRRMGCETPKQFLSVHGKPVILYTLEAFQRHPEIEEIGVACLDGWQPFLAAAARRHGIGKLAWVVPGGETGQASIRSGVWEAERRYRPDDLILVHDAIRPLVSREIISDCIAQCRQFGSAVAAVPCHTAVLRQTGPAQSGRVIPRELLAMTQTPQAFPIGRLAEAHRKALALGITDSAASCTMLIELGETVHLSAGAATNLKLTTPDDLLLFQALLAVEAGAE